MNTWTPIIQKTIKKTKNTSKCVPKKWHLLLANYFIVSIINIVDF
jgi:hypothetical protein